jgi:hypothetical protein
MACGRSWTAAAVGWLLALRRAKRCQTEQQHELESIDDSHARPSSTSLTVICGRWDNDDVESARGDAASLMTGTVVAEWRRAVEQA